MQGNTSSFLAVYGGCEDTVIMTPIMMTAEFQSIFFNPPTDRNNNENDND
jgi:hypothetical protein